MTPVLELRSVSRAYRRGVPVLDDVSLSIGKGEVVALLGRNGAGKTTLVQIALGLLLPDNGSVALFGMSPSEFPIEVKRRIGMVAEHSVFPRLARMEDILALHRSAYPTWDVSLERELFERFEFPMRKMPVLGLSKGKSQQFALLCAVCHRPELLILDEPAAGLDAVVRREMLEMTIRLLQDSGTSVLFSSHQLDDVERLGARVLLLSGGKITVDQTVDDLRELHCLAIVSRTVVPDVATLERIPGCLRVRAVENRWHAVFAGSCNEVEVMVRAQLGSEDVYCTTLPLEEMFIELVGNSPAAGVS